METEKLNCPNCKNVVDLYQNFYDDDVIQCPFCDVIYTAKVYRRFSKNILTINTDETTFEVEDVDYNGLVFSEEEIISWANRISKLLKEYNDLKNGFQRQQKLYDLYRYGKDSKIYIDSKPLYLDKEETKYIIEFLMGRNKKKQFDILKTLEYYSFSCTTNI